MLSLVPTAELPWYRHTWDRNEIAHRGEAFDEHAPLVDELLGTDPRARADVGGGPRAARGHRLVLAADEPGAGHARGAGGGRDPRDRAARGQPARLRPRRAPFPADLLARRVPEEDSCATSSCRATAATGCSGATGEHTPFAGIGEAPIRQRVLGGGWWTAGAGPRGGRGVPGAALRGRGRGADPRRGPASAVSAGEGPVHPGVAFVAALDPLAWDRDLLRRLFAFDYVRQVYVPAPQRRHGYYTRRSCSATGSSDGWTRGADRKEGTLAILGRGGRTGSTRCRRRTRGSWMRSSRPCGLTWHSRTRGRWHRPGSRGIARSRRRCELASRVAIRGNPRPARHGMGSSSWSAPGASYRSHLGRSEVIVGAVRG